MEREKGKLESKNPNRKKQKKDNLGKKKRTWRKKRKDETKKKQRRKSVDIEKIPIKKSKQKK
jgi:hypothetical protein